MFLPDLIPRCDTPWLHFLLSPGLTSMPTEVQRGFLDPSCWCYDPVTLLGELWILFSYCDSLYLSLSLASSVELKAV